MFKDIRVVLDQAGYDVEQNQSLIQGWAIDPVTKSPVEIECSIPATINTMYRPDINIAYGVDRDVEYGFFIQFPGSVHEIKPTITFKTKEITESIGGLAFDANFMVQPLGKLYKNLMEQGLLPEIKNPIRSIKKIIDNQRGTGRTPREQPLDRFHDWMVEYEESEFTPIEEIRELESGSSKKPTFSFIITSKEDPKNDLARTIYSVQDQLLGEGEIIIATEENLPRKIMIKEPLKLVKRDTLAEAINDAAEAATGDYLVFLDNGDLASNHLIPEVLNDIYKNGEADFIYADSDKIDKFDDRYEPQFKPDYDEILLRSHNYILQPVVMKKELFKKIGGVREDRLGLQNYDLILRATENAESIHHIPKILYHWFIENKSVEGDEKYLDEYKLGQKILDERFGDPNEEHWLSEIDYLYDLHNRGNEEKKITLITGVLDGFDEKKARETVENIVNASDYPNLQVIAANINGLPEDKRIKVIENKEIESMPELYNTLAGEADGDIIIFINPGFKAVESAWMSELADYLSIDEVGIVGPRFYRDTYQIDQAGVEIRDGRRYDIGRGAYCRAGGYNHSLRAPREIFAVSNNCLAIERELFEDLGGFDLSLLPSESDIDLCIRARDMGKKVVVQNNVSATVDGFDDQNGALVNGLYERYGEEKLKNVFLNDNLKPGSSAFEFAPVGV